MWKSHDPPKASIKSTLHLSSLLFIVLIAVLSELWPIPACLDLQMRLLLNICDDACVESNLLLLHRSYLEMSASNTSCQIRLFISSFLQVFWSLPYSLQSYFGPTHLPGGGNAESVFVNKKEHVFLVMWLTTEHWEEKASHTGLHANVECSIFPAQIVWNSLYMSLSMYACMYM